MHSSSRGDSGNKRGQMEVNSSGIAPAGLRHRPLTPFRILRGIICIFIYLSSAFMVLIYCAPATTVILRLFSKYYSRRATSMVFSAWLALWPFLFEKINKTKVIFSGDLLPEEQRVIIIANHRTEVDWMYLWDMALRKHCLGYMKYILKNSLMKLPIFGWGFHVLEFISVQRKWEADKSTIRQMLSTFKDPQDHLWLALFPEGTDFTDQKCAKSQEFAAENGLPILNNVLLPKVKGFSTCIEDLRSSICAVYDLTIGYKHRCPLFTDNVFGVDPSEVHIHVKRFLPSEIPEAEDDMAAWLMDRFKVKDQLLSNFAAEGHFPSEISLGDFPTMGCLASITFTLVLSFICMYLTFFSHIWFKIYVAVSCIYLASATYFNYRPRPVFGSLISSLHRKKAM